MNDFPLLRSSQSVVSLMEIAKALGSTAWRRYIPIAMLVLAGIYVGSYLEFRMRHEIVHIRTYSGEGIHHAVRPVLPEGPSVFVTLAISGRLDQLDSVEAGLKQRRSLLALFYSPLCLGERLVWELID